MNSVIIDGNRYIKEDTRVYACNNLDTIAAIGLTLEESTSGSKFFLGKEYKKTGYLFDLKTRWSRCVVTTPGKTYVSGELIIKANALENVFSGEKSEQINFEVWEAHENDLVVSHRPVLLVKGYRAYAISPRNNIKENDSWV